MIKTDQPTIFGKDVIAAVSSVNDGNMKFGVGDPKKALQNRHVFLEQIGINPNETTLVGITYNTDDFAKYRIVTAEDKGVGMQPDMQYEAADALVTRESGHALFLPLADCAGLILYDANQHILMVSHVGRHSAEIDGAAKSVAYLEDNFATNPKNLKVWVSPAVGNATYPIHAKGDKSLHEVIAEQLAQAGMPSENVEISDVDTAEDENYYSHSQFKVGNRDFDGRFAVVAMMMDAQGEPAF